MSGTRAVVTQVQAEVDAQLEKALTQYCKAVHEAGGIADADLAEVRGSMTWRGNTMTSLHLTIRIRDTDTGYRYRISHGCMGLVDQDAG